MRDKIEVGSIVKIVNLSRVFSNYSSWFDVNAPEYKSIYTGGNAKMNEIGYVLAKGKHTYPLDLYLVATKLGAILISENGLELMSTMPSKPTKVYQLYEYYSREENRGDEFKVRLNGGEERTLLFNENEIKIIKSNGKLTDVGEFISTNNMYLREVRLIEKNKMTLEEIEEALGYKIELVQDIYSC